MSKTPWVGTVEMTDAEAAVITQAASHRKVTIERFIIDAAAAQAEKVLEWKRRDEAGELSCGCKIGACICDFA